MIFSYNGGGNVLSLFNLASSGVMATFNAGDRTWNDTFPIIVQCFGVVGKPVPKEVIVEVDGVVIDKA